MRWRFADRIDQFEPWVLIQGRKGISLEEYSLLERFGRRGVLAESLVLESCVHFARWLVERSSGFAQSCLVDSIDDFAFVSPASMGDNLGIGIVLETRWDDRVVVRCRADAGERRVAQGNLELRLVPLPEVADAQSQSILWQKLYGASQGS